ncbi:MAG: HAD family phosphatase [Selenomonadaceae bacterium]|nr:HAD family phosphatase [Selenomonadaceae bacterium]
MIKLIMSDMDGTLLDDKGMLPPGFDEVIAKLKARGVMFAPASGRQYYSLLESFPKYKNDFMFVAENGTMVRYKGKIISASPMRKVLAYQVLDAVADDEGVLRVYCGLKDGYVLNTQDEQAFMDELHKYFTRTNTVTDFRAVDDEPIKISFFDPEGKAAARIYPKVQPFAGPLQVVLASDYWVDVMAFGINKGLAIQKVQRKLHITPMECAAFGDYMNDAEMMSSVYYSFAMANALPKIKELARFQAKSNAEHGVIHAIEDLIAQGLCGKEVTSR